MATLSAPLTSPLDLYQNITPTISMCIPTNISLDNIFITKQINQHKKSPLNCKYKLFANFKGELLYCLNFSIQQHLLDTQQKLLERFLPGQNMVTSGFGFIQIHH